MAGGDTRPVLQRSTGGRRDGVGRAVADVTEPTVDTEPEASVPDAPDDVPGVAPRNRRLRARVRARRNDVLSIRGRFVSRWHWRLPTPTSHRIVVEPPAIPVAPGPNRTAVPVAGVAPVEPLAISASSTTDGVVIVDGDPVAVRLDHLGAVHRAVRDETTDVAAPTRTRVIILPADGPGQHTAAGTTHREVIVDGWRIEVEIESERRASLRERARRSRAETAHGGPTEVRAIIPGVIASVSVVPGDAVVAGQHILVVEAMKMQNELRAPRDGVVSRLAVGAGKTIEVGDLLLVLD